MTEAVLTTPAQTSVPAGLPPRRRSEPRRAWWKTALVTVIAILINLPMLNAIYTSFRPDGDISRAPLSLHLHLTLGHYRNLFNGGSGYDFSRYFLNSVLISLGAVVLVLVLTIPAGYAIVRLGFGGRYLLRGVTALRLVPAIFFAIPFFLLYNSLGLYDTVPSLILANTFLNLPLGLLVLAGALRDLPVEIEEAAIMDGCGVYRTLRSVVLPLLAPALVAVAVLVFLFSWSDYLFAVILSSSNATPVTVGAANFVTSTGIRWGDISAATVLSVLPPLCFAVFAQRALVSGLSAGAVKG
ncbi:carbohydrate ABC transporter permease [Rugosimonospora africana]|uniref:Sugar ABC transporter permease n=1 Tax=Rugosimonospora africana TaxID=556532 RepID=A0A8J3QU68_9ACTN|nr:carbohydrate ABC transporter permease [Rugosimonospora africana]GIH17164.1 sugar ABC transporter permease [Rugosimonospora africana]